MRRLRIGGRLPKEVILGEGRFDRCSECTEHWLFLSVMVLRHVYNFMQNITRVLRSIPPIETLSPREALQPRPTVAAPLCELQGPDKAPAHLRPAAAGILTLTSRELRITGCLGGILFGYV